MDKKSRILFICFLLAFFLAVGFSYWRVVVQKNYQVVSSEEAPITGVATEE